ncbi:MAG: Jag N-terminal domain-containing protein [Elusimicrobia bacterium]|nr:Jag N-terminal domain-containing protein [Elusimicrobiota bacterium]
MKKEIEMQGKTVTIAVESGLKELGLRRDQAEVQVIEEGSAGFLGIGAKPARVLIREKRWGSESGAVEPPSVRPQTPKPSPPRAQTPKPSHQHRGRRPQAPAPRPSAEEERAPEKPKADVPVDTSKACETAQAVVKDLLALTGLAAPTLRTGWDSEQVRVRIEVDTPDAALLIGKAGKTLESLQFLVTVIVGRRIGAPVAVQVDSQGYWKRIEERIVSDIQAAVSDVKRTGQPWRFDPMGPAMRRLVHRKLMNHPDVETASEGEGPWRKVVVKPRRK